MGSLLETMLPKYKVSKQLLGSRIHILMLKGEEGVKIRATGRDTYKSKIMETTMQRFLESWLTLNQSDVKSVSCNMAA